jgi:hypothetical protein
LCLSSFTLYTHIHIVCKNEHICATAIYYYDSSNITKSCLSFRQQCHIELPDEVPYEEYHYDWPAVVFGCERGMPAMQDIGDVVTQQGRLLTFPNIVQHRVGPFQLVDKSKPGHRKILALLLVDPHTRIISSANVPCQRKDWWAHELHAQGALASLPNELLNEVVDNVRDFPMSLDEAHKLKLELIEERRAFVRQYAVKAEWARFSLWW